jgi:hypothetical protein
MKYIVSIMVLALLGVSNAVTSSRMSNLAQKEKKKGLLGGAFSAVGSAGSAIGSGIGNILAQKEKKKGLIGGAFSDVSSVAGNILAQ